VGTLFVVATPIGNLEDTSPRALRILNEVSVIAAEDTRHSRRLLAHFAISTPLISYHAHNQRARRSQILKALAEGDVALISDAGTPAISDPGADLVAAALAAGHRVSPIPGPSSLSAAISASGLIDGPFMMLGFLPRERAERAIALGRAAAAGLPLVLFEAANRLAKTLAELETTLGNRQAVALRELTKIHEEVRPGDLASLRSWAEETVPRGEVVLVIGGAAAQASPADEAKEIVVALRRSGLSASRSAREAAEMTGLPRSDLYRMALAAEAPRSVGLEGELALPDEDTLQEPFGDEERPER
jgi:16S rRNA (cytidine1402-2'-O)-methyltransferase